MSDAHLLLKMEQVDKVYPGVHALDHVDFDLYAGEVHVLLGENGAGKSTLMKILQGVVSRDGGRIFVEGQEIGDLTPQKARDLGIAMVFQELSLLPNLTVAENILMGQLPRNRVGMIDWRQTFHLARETMSELGVDIDVRREVRSLNIAEQQLTEIASILTRNPRIILLDEPTSALSDTERERLFDIIKRLQANGVGIMYVSHHLSEVPLIGQRVTVLRDGRRIGTLPVEETTSDKLVEMMVGRELSDLFPKHQAKRGKVMFQVKDLSLPEKLHDLSFEVHEGEILGIFGLMGAGQPELARSIFGLEPDAQGRIEVDGQPIVVEKPIDAIRHGVGLLPRDRRASLVPHLTITENTTLASVSQQPLSGLLNLRKEMSDVADYVRDLQIRPPNLKRHVVNLSGGNQQKVVIARWLFSQAKVLIFDQPTRGIDVGAKAEVYGLMNDLTERGAAVVMISTELPEILAMSDRILVIRKGRFTGEFTHEEVTQELLMKHAG